MNIFEQLKLIAVRSRLDEEALYQIVHDELEQGLHRDGLWAKAFAESAGDILKTEALYIKYRVQSLKDEIALLSSNTTPPQISSEPLQFNKSEEENSTAYYKFSDSDEIGELIKVMSNGNNEEVICNVLRELIRTGYDKESLADLVEVRGDYELAREVRSLIECCELKENGKRGQ